MTTREGYEVVHMWDLSMPRADMEHLGFPVLNSAIHHTVYAPRTREQGGYNHHPRIFHHAEQFHAIWSNHAYGEDGPGQRVLYSRSSEINDLGREPVEVFPAPGPVKPSEENGLVCTAFRILEKDSRLFAIAGLNANVGFQSPDAASFGPVRNNQHPMRRRQGFSPLAREILPGNGFGPIVNLVEDLPRDLQLPLGDLKNPVVADTRDCAMAGFSDPRTVSAWNWNGRIGCSVPNGVDGHCLCEPVCYFRKSGEQVLLMRDKFYSHRMYCSVRSAPADDWPPARPTDIPDSPSLACTINLNDGYVLLIGNQTAPEFDNGDVRQHYDRDPLVVSVSADGVRFIAAFALRCGLHSMRIPDVLGRGGGGQYPHGIVVDDVLHVIYSMGKEDIAVSSIGLSELGFQYM